MVWDTVYGGIVMKEIVPMDEHQADQIQAMKDAEESSTSQTTTATAATTATAEHQKEVQEERIQLAKRATSTFLFVPQQVIVGSEGSWIAIMALFEKTTQIAISPLYLDSSSSLSSVIGSVSQSIEYLTSSRALLPSSSSSPSSWMSSVTHSAAQQSRGGNAETQLMEAPEKYSANLLYFLNRLAFGLPPPRLPRDVALSPQDSATEQAVGSPITYDRTLAFQWTPSEWSNFSSHPDSRMMQKIFSTSNLREFEDLVATLFDAHVIIPSGFDLFSSLLFSSFQRRLTKRPQRRRSEIKGEGKVHPQGSQTKDCDNPKERR